MSDRPIQFLSIDDILQLHQIAIRDQGGDASIRDVGLLESAMAMPKQQSSRKFLHPDIPSMAAAYAFHICMNHPFVDGNKRAATAAMIVFLSDNGWAFDATADDAEPLILQLASGGLDKPSLTAWLFAHCREKKKIELRDFFHRVTVDDFMSVLSSMSSEAGGSLAEFKATAFEAASAMPIIAELNRFVSELHDDPKSGTRPVQQTIIAAQTFMTLFRLAEEQGYEW